MMLYLIPALSPPPKSGDGKGAVVMRALLISFTVSVIAGVVANYLFQWLNRDG